MTRQTTERSEPALNYLSVWDTVGSYYPQSYQPRSQADSPAPAAHGGVSADQLEGGPSMQSRQQADSPVSCSHCGEGPWPGRVPPLHGPQWGWCPGSGRAWASRPE